MTQETQDDDSIEYENKYERKRELLKNRELTDEEAKRIAETTGQKDPGDLYERKLVPVSIKNGKVEIGSVYRLSGNESVRWNDEVVGTFGAGGTTPEEVRQAFSEAKARMIQKLYDQEQYNRV